MPWFRQVVFGCFLTIAACECGGTDLRVGGDHPYVRCMAIEPEDGEIPVLGGVVDGRELTVQGVESLEFFSVRGRSVASLQGSEASGLQVVLGGFARDASTAVELLEALAARGPALLLPGGEDSNEVLDDALDEVSEASLIDLRGISRVSFGEGPGLLVVPGAPGGRYARGDDACGYSPEDVEGLNDSAQEGDRLLSWMAPRSEGGVDVGLLGNHVGDPELRDLQRHHELAGGVFAYPREAAGFADSAAFEFVVGPLGALIVAARGGRSLGESLRFEVGAEWALED